MEALTQNVLNIVFLLQVANWSSQYSQQTRLWRSKVDFQCHEFLRIKKNIVFISYLLMQNTKVVIKRQRGKMITITMLD